MSQAPPSRRDHGGGLDAAAAAFGGAREDWLDLSTGINPVPYPVGHLTQDAWTALPDQSRDRPIHVGRACVLECAGRGRA
jgi:cobalamin biosynthetic protein CobC